MKRLLIATLAAGVVVAGCGGGSAPSDPSHAATATPALANVGGPGPDVRLPPGQPPKRIVVKDLKKGSGAEAKVGYEAFIRYVGVRWNGEIYSNSWTEDAPPSFVLGAHELTIGGLEKNIEGMRVGGRREIFLPPSAHIERGVSRESPAEVLEETLAYVVDLVKVRPEFKKLRALQALSGN